MSSVEAKAQLGADGTKAQERKINHSYQGVEIFDAKTHGNARIDVQVEGLDEQRDISKKEIDALAEQIAGKISESLAVSQRELINTLIPLINDQLKTVLTQRSIATPHDILQICELVMKTIDEAKEKFQKNLIKLEGETPFQSILGHVMKEMEKIIPNNGTPENTQKREQIEAIISEILKEKAEDWFKMLDATQINIDVTQVENRLREYVAGLDKYILERMTGVCMTIAENNLKLQPLIATKRSDPTKPISTVFKEYVAARVSFEIKRS